MKQDNARKWFKPEDWPALSALSLIILSLFLFGADTRIASLITSALILIITCIAQFIARDFRPTPWTVLFILIWAILLVVHLATNKVSDGIHEYIMIFAGGCVFWIGRYASLSARRRGRIFRILALICFTFGFLAFLQHVGAPETVLGEMKIYHQTRLSGPFLSANTFSTFAAALILFLFYYLLRPSRRSARDGDGHAPSFLSLLLSKPIALSALAFLSVDLILAASRAGLGAFCLAAIVFFSALAILSPRLGASTGSKSVYFFGIVCLVVLLFSGMLWLSGSGLESRLSAPDGSSLHYRQVIADVSWQIGSKAPLTGHGLESFNDEKATFATAENNKILISQNAAHNLFLQWFVQAGWPGLICIGLVFVIFFVRAWCSRVNQSAAMTAFQFGFLTLLLTHSLFDYGLEIPSVFLLTAFFLGITSAKPQSHAEFRSQKPLGHHRFVATVSRWAPATVFFVLSASLLALSLISAQYTVETRNLKTSASSVELTSTSVANRPLAPPSYYSGLASAMAEADPPRFDLAIEATHLSLAKGDRKPNNLMRLAFIDAMTHSTLTPEGLSAIQKSYDLSPYGPVEDMKWRLQFGDTLWESLPETLKRATLTQVTGLSLQGWDEQQWLKRFARTAHPDIKARILRSLPTES